MEPRDKAIIQLCADVAGDVDDQFKQFAAIDKYVIERGHTYDLRNMGKKITLPSFVDDDLIGTENYALMFELVEEFLRKYYIESAKRKSMADCMTSTMLHVFFYSKLLGFVFEAPDSLLVDFKKCLCDPAHFIHELATDETILLFHIMIVKVQHIKLATVLQESSSITIK